MSQPLPVSRQPDFSGPPLIFISHRHHDAAIAKAVADWLMVATSNRVKLFQSSDGLRGPEVARSITDTIRQKVAESSVLLAIYTDQDADWAWVMFEMGIAMDPSTPVTRVIVFQCGEDAPAILSDFKRVRASSIEDRVGLARDLLDTGFFPTHPDMRLAGSEALGELASEHATLLWKKLEGLIPPPEAIRREWSPHPKLRLEVPLNALGALSPVDASRLEGLQMPIREQCRVVAEEDASVVFNMQTLRGKTLAELKTALALANQAEWIDSCVGQIAHCVVDNRPTTRMIAVTATSGVVYQPLVERIHHKWFEKVVRFDVVFVPRFLLESPEANASKGRKAAGARA